MRSCVCTVWRPRRFMPSGTPTRGQVPLPIQPVAQPILCKPYEEPREHWVYDRQSGEAQQQPGRRPAGFWFKDRAKGHTTQLSFLEEEHFNPLELVNRLREDVGKWRASAYEGATPVTKELLHSWWRTDRPRRLFFCQLEAVETTIYVAEIRLGGKRTRFNPSFTEDDLKALVDDPGAEGLLPIQRLD